MHEEVFTFKSTEEEKQMWSEVLSSSRSLNVQCFKKHVLLCEPYSTYNPTITDIICDVTLHSLWYFSVTSSALPSVERSCNSQQHPLHLPC